MQWVGNDPIEYNSWEPYTELRHVEAPHTYLREHKMASLIPQRAQAHTIH
jgi:hypothetical protein